MKLSIDFETRSRCDLLRWGIYNYALDESTDVICMAWKQDDQPAFIWYPPYFSRILKRSKTDDVIWQSFLTALTNATIITAHNAQFERLIWKHVMQPRMAVPSISLPRWRCSAAHAASLSLPRSLAALAQAVGASEQKDKRGMELIKALSNPKDDGSFCEDAKLIREMGDYCKQDVETEYAVSRLLPPFPVEEQHVWELDQMINDRGVAGDIDGVKALMALVSAEESKLLEKVSKLTENKLVSARQVSASLEWLKDEGVELPDFRKQTVIDALADGGLPVKAEQFLKLRQSLSKSSVGKLQAFVRFAQPDHRLRGLLLYHGASTGRWAGRGIQPQNFPRDSFKTEQEVEDTIAGKTPGCPIMAASRALRGLLWSKEGTLIAVDFSSIEARVLAWVAGEEHILRGFQEGRDMYKVAASAIYGIPYEQISKDDPERQVGKTAELALGYQGWTAAFRTMGANLGVQLLDREHREKLTAEWKANKLVPHPEDPQNAHGRAQTMFKTVDAYVEAHEDARAVEIVKPWRQARPATRALWYGLDDAARSAVKNPGNAFMFAGIKFAVLRGYLFMRLPSGRNLAYYAPQIENKIDKYRREKEVVTFMGLDTANRWTRLSTYGGKLTENVVQALARDLLVHSMRAADFFGYDVVMHVHDEFVVEADGPEHLALLEKLAVILPPWAEGLPMAAEGWAARRYKK